MKILFTIAALLTFALGVGWLLFPQAVLSAWGGETDAVGLYLGRRYGGLFFGYSVILWTARRAAAGTALTAILAGSAVVTAVLAIVSIAGAMHHVVGPALWGAAAVEIALAAAFLYYGLRGGGPGPGGA